MCCCRRDCCRDPLPFFDGFADSFVPPQFGAGRSPQRVACDVADGVANFIRDMKPSEEVVVERAPEGESRFFTVTIRVKDDRR